MGPFWARLRKGLKWLWLCGAAVWPYVWDVIAWIADQVAGDWVVRELEPRWDGLPDAPVVLTTLIDWSRSAPVGTAVVIAAVVVVVTFVWALIDTRRRTPPPAPSGQKEKAPRVTVTPHGGKDARLEVRNNGGTARFTGEGQFMVGKCQEAVTHAGPFRLMWWQPTGVKTDFDNIGSGDFGAVVLAEAHPASDGSSMHIAIWGNGGGVSAWTRKRLDSGEYEHVKNIRVRVRVKANPPLQSKSQRDFDIIWDGSTQQFTVTPRR